MWFVVEGPMQCPGGLASPRPGHARSSWPRPIPLCHLPRGLWNEDCEPQQRGSREDAWPTKWPECSPRPLSRISRRNQSSQHPTPAAQVWARCSLVWVWPQSTTTLTCPTGARAASGLPGTLDPALMSLLVPTPAAPQWALPRSLTP